MNSNKRHPKDCKKIDEENLKEACVQADKAYHLDIKDRANLLVDFNNHSFSEENKLDDSLQGIKFINVFKNEIITFVKIITL